MLLCGAKRDGKDRDRAGPWPKLPLSCSLCWFVVPFTPQGLDLRGLQMQRLRAGQ